MPVFISYSQKDNTLYEKFCLELDVQNIIHWNSGSMQAGKSLPGQLRSAISSCDVCVFLATEKSIKSQWCNAELGAFWGKGTTVIVYILDRGLSIKKIPPQFKADLFTRKKDKVFASIKAELASVAEQKQIDYGIKILKPIHGSIFKKAVEVSGTFTKKPAFRTVAIWESDANGSYWPKKYIDFGHIGNSWSVKIGMGGKANSKRTIIITTMGENGKAIFEYARSVIESNKESNEKYAWPGVQLLPNDIIFCDSVEVIKAE